MMDNVVEKEEIDLPVTREQILEDYRIAYRSRQASLIGRREVLSGRAKFGIFGDGKEVAQVAMAHAFKKGDWRSGYYRDQTLMLALGELTVQQFFAQLYAHTDLEAEPMTGGRLMNAHFATRSLNPDGSWRDLTQQYNTSADVSPTAAQMPRLVGLAYASRLYREIEELKEFTQFSRNGDEVAFGTIGNASTAEGHFWEAVNAIGVLKSPAVISIWDDGYGISVPNQHQMIKEDISALLRGFQRDPECHNGYDIYTVKGWDYAELVRVYQQAAEIARAEHVPSLIHVQEMTQPQGHSTSGSHERYKSEARLAWEAEHDGLTRMRAWMIEQGIVDEEEIEQIEKQDLRGVRREQQAAWKAFNEYIDQDKGEVAAIMERMAQEAHGKAAAEITAAKDGMLKERYPTRRAIMEAIFDALLATRHAPTAASEALLAWRRENKPRYQAEYSSDLYSETAQSQAHIEEVKPVYAADAPEVNGYEILNRYFDSMFARDARIITFGEDVGYIGGVNQTMAGLQAKYGELRVSDTGIREATILGQAIGMALRGLRPIAEIQYLDYILYALQIMSDDLATLRWRTRGGQKAPVIVRTRGHRLEGVWHSGSPMGGVIHMLRGVHVLVPRDMTRAVGFYNTLLKSDDPGLVIEVLNGYRKKERLPENLADITIPLGVPEILRQGKDVTVVTYGAMCAVAMRAAADLEKVGIDAEVIDVQSFLPFDVERRIVESLKKTNRIVFVDEDVPAAITASMMQQVLEAHGGYHFLDAEPRTLTAKEHRPAYGTDGNYFSKPNAEQIFKAVYGLMHDADPRTFPIFYHQDGE